MKHRWTPQEFEFLKNSYKKIPLCEIAKKLGLPESKILNKAIKSKLTPFKSWSKKEDDFILANYGKLTAKEIGEILNVNKTQIYNRAWDLGLGKKHNNYTLSIDSIKTELLKGISLTEIAENFNIKRKTITRFCLKNGYDYKKDYKFAKTYHLDDERFANKVYRDYVQSAKSRNYIFELTFTDLKKLIKNNCHYCNSPPSNIKHNNNKSKFFYYNGLDRKDNNIGYTLDNVVSCCIKCNKGKAELSSDEFIDLITKIYNNLVVGK